jgi:hypothetical protein
MFLFIKESIEKIVVVVANKRVIRVGWLTGTCLKTVLPSNIVVVVFLVIVSGAEWEPQVLENSALDVLMDITCFVYFDTG